MLYQLSYASGAVHARESEGQHRRGPMQCQAFAPGAGFSHKRKGSLEKERKDFPSRVPRLPLPEKTGSDRDEPHCLPGFVDRAYLVFFVSNYGPQLLHLRTALDRTRVPLTPFEFSPPILSAVSGGVRAPGDPSPTFVRFIGCGATRVTAERRRRCRFALWRALWSSPLSPGGLTPQPCSRSGLRPVSTSAYPHGLCHAEGAPRGDQVRRRNR